MNQMSEARQADLPATRPSVVDDGPPSGPAAPRFPDNETERLAALDRLRILDTTSESVFDDLVTLASEICGTPIALVSLVDHDRQWFKARVGLEARQTPREIALCAHAIADPTQLFTVVDASVDARFADNPLVTGEPHVRFYAGAPIVTEDGHALGTVCVIDTKPRVLTKSQSECMRALARQASSLMALRKQSIAAAAILDSHAHMTLEARLKEEKGAELLDLVLQGRGLGLWDLDVASGLWKASSHELEMLGHAAGTEVSEARWTQFVHPDDLPLTRTSMEAHLRGEIPFYECTIRMRHREGHWIWMLSRAVVVERHADGTPLRIVGTHEDITEQRRLEQERRQSEVALITEFTRRKALLARATEFVFVLDQEMRLKEVNPSFTEALGHSRQELMKLRPWHWEALTPTREEFHRRWSDRTSVAWTAETRWKRRDGTVFDVALSCTTVSFEGEREFLFVCHDITDSKRARAALERARHLLEQTGRLAQVGGWELDIATSRVTWTEEVHRIHEVSPGYTPDLAGALDFYPAEVRPVLIAAVEQAIENGTPYDFELPLVTARDRHIWVRSIGRVEHDDEGRAVRLVGAFQDITERRDAAQASIRSEHRLRMITDHTPALIMYIDRDERYAFANAHFGRVFGIDPQSIVGRTLLEVCGAGVYADIAPHVRMALRGEATQFEASGPARGGLMHYQSHYVPDAGPDGVVAGFYALVFDVTARKNAELKSAEDERRLRGIADHVPALIAEVGVDGRFTFANATYRHWLGVDHHAMVGKDLPSAIGDAYHADRADEMRRALAGEMVSFERQVTLPVGERTLHSTYVPHFDDAGRVAGFYALTNDITELKRTQTRLDALARADALTGLPNRRHLEVHAAEALARARRSGQAGVLFYLDVDHFKTINDSLGHAIGDEVLQEFARRLQHCLRETDFVARYAGDEFVTIAESVACESDAVHIAGKIIEAIRGSFTLSSICVNVTTSIGVAVFDGRESWKSILGRADAALYVAKARGRDGFAMATGVEPAHEDAIPIETTADLAA